MGFSLDMLAEQQDTVNCPLMIPPPPSAAHAAVEDGVQRRAARNKHLYKRITVPVQKDRFTESQAPILMDAT